jgi:hypothetical protein
MDRYLHVSEEINSLKKGSSIVNRSKVYVNLADDGCNV